MSELRILETILHFRAGAGRINCAGATYTEKRRKKTRDVYKVVGCLMQYGLGA